MHFSRQKKMRGQRMWACNQIVIVWEIGLPELNLSGWKPWSGVWGTLLHTSPNQPVLPASANSFIQIGLRVAKQSTTHRWNCWQDYERKPTKARVKFLHYLRDTEKAGVASNKERTEIVHPIEKVQKVWSTLRKSLKDSIYIHPGPRCSSLPLSARWR